MQHKVVYLLMTIGKNSSEYPAARGKNTRILSHSRLFISTSGGSSGTWKADIVLFTCGKSENQEYFRIPHSSHFLILLLLFYLIA